MSEVVTLTFFKYETLSNKIWAFLMMQFMHKRLKKIEGQSLYKLLGSGKNGFSPLPDWGVYALLQVWKNEEAANTFFTTSTIIKSYKEKSCEIWSVFLKTISTKGTWSGVNPFKRNLNIERTNSFIAVITRATIKTKMLYKFWKYVPISQHPLSNCKGLLFTKGIGEVPFKNMATFSIWENKEALISFAYKTKEHNEAIKKTKKLDWYKEEMFCRFQPYKSIGTWNNKNPLFEL
ncbi:DUF3291 domain-containing protein [Aquimarina algicola]|uniref:DUF3291 domain-containing protein n=1 Tax=Aquimarina algicola TaxID=2589995 RepID=A0A504J382_9FLAO|nr:DUF3291 domain-containing protein [Aquimarina algicola]TPN85337.1 DUF3291 domain-containing protein [Aquimarina algicola]